MLAPLLALTILAALEPSPSQPPDRARPSWRQGDGLLQDRGRSWPGIPSLLRWLRYQLAEGSRQRTGQKDGTPRNAKK